MFVPQRALVTAFVGGMLRAGLVIRVAKCALERPGEPSRKTCKLNLKLRVRTAGHAYGSNCTLCAHCVNK